MYNGFVTAAIYPKYDTAVALRVAACLGYSVQISVCVDCQASHRSSAIRAARERVKHREHSSSVQLEHRACTLSSNVCQSYTVQVTCRVANQTLRNGPVGPPGKGIEYRLCTALGHLEDSSAVAQVRADIAVGTGRDEIKVSLVYNHS